jgi:lysophospholipase L1-like esterase
LRPLIVLGGLVAVSGLVLAAEIGITLSREYLPGGPGYLIDERVGNGPGPALRLVILGDSTVAGVGSPKLAESLPVLLAQRVAGALDREVHVVGYGVSGARTEDVQTEQVPLLLDEGVDVVMIVIGSNDVTHMTPPWSMEDSTAAMLRAAHDRTGAPIVLGGIPRFRAVPALAEPLRTLVDSYARPLRSAQRTAVEDVDVPVRFVDIAAEASPRFVGRPESTSSDGFHPSPIGYGFWADSLAPAIVEAVS